MTHLSHGRGGPVAPQFGSMMLADQTTKPSAVATVLPCGMSRDDRGSAQRARPFDVAKRSAI